MNKIIKISLATLAFSIISTSAHAENVQEMFIAFSNSYSGIWKFMLGTSYLIGLFLMCASVFAWSKVMEGRSNMSLKVPISLFIVGTLIFQIKNALTVIEDTFSMAHDGVLGAAGGGGGGSAAGAGAVAAIMGFVQILGFIAFVRGFLILHKYNTGEQRDGLGRAITHIVGGAMAINIKWTAAMLADTFAPGLKGTLASLGVI